MNTTTAIETVKTASKATLDVAIKTGKWAGRQVSCISSNVVKFASAFAYRAKEIGIMLLNWLQSFSATCYKYLKFGAEKGLIGAKVAKDFVIVNKTGILFGVGATFSILAIVLLVKKLSTNNSEQVPAKI